MFNTFFYNAKRKKISFFGGEIWVQLLHKEEEHSDRAFVCLDSELLGVQPSQAGKTDKTGTLSLNAPDLNAVSWAAEKGIQCCGTYFKLSMLSSLNQNILESLMHIIQIVFIITKTILLNFEVFSAQVISVCDTFLFKFTQKIKDRHTLVKDTILVIWLTD